MQLVPASFRPPSLAALTAASSYRSAVQPFDHLLAENDFALAEPAPDGFAPFVPPADPSPALYLGFDRPGAATGFANDDVALFLAVAQPVYGGTDTAPAGSPPRVGWSYWDGGGGQLAVQDETQDLTRPGVVSFVGPPDFGTRSDFGRDAFWLRATRDGGDAALPRLEAVLLNTAWASQRATVTEEVLGSSSGEPAQSFATSRQPVLDGQQLWVREAGPPPAAERAAILAEEGPDAVDERPGAGPGTTEIRVRWHQVPDFYGSSGRSRHYVLDRLGRHRKFGDGVRGLIPPPGASNLLLTYASGGGAVGNRPAETVSQLQTTVPSVASVTNHLPVAGGADAETPADLQARGPRTLRHGGRAVALDDFADPARLASPGVARAKALGASGEAQAGQVEVMLVAAGSDPRPAPTLELIDRVADYLRARLTPTADLLVRGPTWLAVAVEVDLVPLASTSAAEVRGGVLAGLTAYLHPLTGGADGAGWDFGQRPHRSDLIALVEGLPGVDHVRHLAMAEAADGPILTGRFLVCSGDHRVTLVTDEEG